MVSASSSAKKEWNFMSILTRLPGDTKGLGAFSEYTLADEQLCFKLPPNLTRAEAATVPLAACTAWLALFSRSCLGMDQKQGPDNTILIWGGSCKAQ